MGDIAGELDYVRGMDIIGGKVYAANVGQNTGHPERNGVAVIDIATASVETIFATGSDGQGFGFDVLSYPYNAGSTVVPLGSTLLVPDQSSVDEGLEDGEDIDVFRTDAAFVDTFHDSDGVNGIDNPMQLVRTRWGTVLTAGFTGPLFGIFEYDRSGEEINFFFIPDTNVFGLYPLENGNILFSTFDGVFVLDPSNPDSQTNTEPIATGIVAAFIEKLDASVRSRLPVP